MLDSDSTKWVLEDKTHSAQNMEHIATFRGINAEGKSQIADYVHDPAMQNRFIAQTIREQFLELFFTSGDANNARAARNRPLSVGIPRRKRCSGILTSERVIVMTPFDNSASIAFGIINTELEVGFYWMMEKYR
ncbi:hypothetical protein PsorP6_015901 [Peronosclerospora sorghi]|uniref:Uncharacterized protein n=1 Tax=Peronosclerospora sorghi TaxID=230839 RepID=A0ACC0WNW7_9STRA|nr:hypothetical protein PsorP6_015901 [Peronosclerospora sorghi]